MTALGWSSCLLGLLSLVSVVKGISVLSTGPHVVSFAVFICVCFSIKLKVTDSLFLFLLLRQLFWNRLPQ